MTRLQTFNISFNGSLFLAFLGIIFLAFLIYFSYKTTIPPLPKLLKIVLIVLRLLALILILLLIFEPQVNLKYVDKLEPKAALFIDNSKSISFKDSLQRVNEIKKLSSEFSYKLGNKLDIYSFGSRPEKVNPDSIAYLKFTEPETNFSSIMSFLKESDYKMTNSRQNYSSIVIVSDGIMTGGSDPTYSAQKLGIPIFTAAVGDSSIQKDAAVKNVLFNQFIYANRTTTIEAVIINNGFESKNAKVILYENNVPIETKEIVFNDNGVNKVKFDYTPKNAGEKKLSVVVQNMPNEATTENNKHIFYAKVLNDKLKILIAAGSPSADVSIIHQSLSSDENLTVKSYVEISPGKFLINPQNSFPDDSADVVILVNFPDENSSSQFITQITSLIQNKNKPYFIVVTAQTSIRRLKELEGVLPFRIGRISSETSNVQPAINEPNFGMIFSKDENISQWDNLPPILKNNSEFIPKPGTIELASVKVNNVPLNAPLITARNIGAQKSIAVLAGNIWKWKLLTADKGLQLFDNFINSSVKWLYNQNKQKQLIIRTSKKNYSIGESVDFTAEVYDQTFSPVENAEVKVYLLKKDSAAKSGENTREIIPYNSGIGIYSGSFTADNPGDYEFTATANYNNVRLTSDTEKFNIGEVEIEKLNTRRNDNFLKALARETSGKYFNITKVDSLIEEIGSINSNYTKDKVSSVEIVLWSNKWILFLVILLFAIEWFLRKRAGMI